MRLQILELPVQHVGNVSHTPFVLVASEIDLGPAAGFTEEFRDQIGAAGFFVSSDVVELGPRAY